MSYAEAWISRGKCSLQAAPHDIGSAEIENSGFLHPAAAVSRKMLVFHD